MVIFFHKGSDEELCTHLLSKGTKDKVKKLTLLCILLQCKHTGFMDSSLFFCAGNWSLFWEEEEDDNDFVPITFQFASSINTTYVFNGFLLLGFC